MIAQREHRRRAARRAFLAEERQTQSVFSRVLIAEQAQHLARTIHRGLQSGGVRAPLEKQAA